MAMESQKDLVRRLLKERGSTGVGAHELTYQHGITRAAAIVHTLRTEEHLPIETRQKQGEQATYILRPRQPVAPRKPDVPGQTGLLPDSELPAISWEQLGGKFGRGAH